MFQGAGCDCFLVDWRDIYNIINGSQTLTVIQTWYLLIQGDNYLDVNQPVTIAQM